MADSQTHDDRRVHVLYLDLDGTVRHGYDELGRFVNCAEDVRVFDGVPDLLQRYKAAGWRIVACSNQGGIALGHMTLDQCMDAMAETYRQCKGAFDRITFCRHHPDAVIGDLAVCWCRKPRPGMVIEAALAMMQQHPDETYPPYLGLFVGDRSEDSGCAENAGLSFMSAADWRAGKHRLEVASHAG